MSKPPPELRTALRIWWPVAADRDELAAAVSTDLNRGHSTFASEVPGTEVRRADQAWSTIAHAVCQAHLNDRTKSDGEDDLVESFGRISDENFGDLFLIAAMHRGDSAAAQALLDRIEQQVKPLISRQWGPAVAQSVSDDLPSRLMIASERGFNRGMPRLLSYAGRSKLTTWLKTIAGNQAIDRSEQDHEVHFSTMTGEEGGALPEIGDPDHDDDAVDAELSDLLREALPEALRRLREVLAGAPAQLNYLSLIGEGIHDPARLTELLGVNKSRITELSQIITRKFAEVLGEVAPELAPTQALDAIASDVNAREGVLELIERCTRGGRETSTPEGVDQ